MKFKIRFWLIILPDVILLYLSLWAAVWLRYGHSLTPADWTAHLRAFSIIYFFWLIVFFTFGLFDVGVFRRYVALLLNLFSAMVVNTALAVSFFYFQPNLILTPRRFLLIETALAFVFILFWHLLIKYFLKNLVVEGVYLFSFNNELSELEAEIKKHNYLGFRVLGHLNEQSLATTAFSKNVGIILPENLQANPGISPKLYRLRTLGVKFYNHKDFYEQLLRRVFLSQINEIWFLENINYTEKRFYNLAKRFLDIIFGIVTFLVFVVTFPFIALAVRLGSPGPALFTQARVGKNGKVFRIFKYRTMDSAGYTNWTEMNDPRITKVGNVLRKTRIDELPQSINLIKGDISLVGPRPEQVGIVEQLRKDLPFYDERHLVKPGITGWAQLNIYAGSLEETRLKLQYDLYYIKHRGFLFDLEIILKTIYYIFTWQGR